MIKPLHDSPPTPSSSFLARRSLIAALAASPALPALAQFRVEVSGVGLTQLPIALVPFKGQDASPQKISAIVQADLERSGQFRGVDASGQVLDETSRPDLALWRQRTADSVVAGSVTRGADGRFSVLFRLWDVVRGQDLGGQSYTVPQADLRLAAHRIADFVYEKLTGEKGIFSTRIAYVTKGGRYTLWVADADGENAQSALASAEPIISPSWSPSGRQVAYVSFESRKPVVYVHNVASAASAAWLANFRGNNSAPAWARPTAGTLLAITLSRDGVSQLYTIPSGGGDARRLTQSNSIDTELHIFVGRQHDLLSRRATGAARRSSTRWPRAAGTPTRSHLLRHLQHFSCNQRRWPVVGLHLPGGWWLQTPRDGVGHRKRGGHHRHDGGREPQFCAQQQADRVCELQA